MGAFLGILHNSIKVVYTFLYRPYGHARQAKRITICFYWLQQVAYNNR